MRALAHAPAVLHVRTDLYRSDCPYCAPDERCALCLSREGGAPARETYLPPPRSGEGSPQPHVPSESPQEEPSRPPRCAGRQLQQPGLPPLYSREHQRLRCLGLGERLPVRRGQDDVSVAIVRVLHGCDGEERGVVLLCRSTIAPDDGVDQLDRISDLHLRVPDVSRCLHVTDCDRWMGTCQGL